MFLMLSEVKFIRYRIFVKHLQIRPRLVSNCSFLSYRTGFRCLKNVRLIPQRKMSGSKSDDMVCNLAKKVC